MHGASGRVTLSLLPFSSANFQGIFEEQPGPFGNSRSGVKFQQFLRQGPQAIFQFRDSVHHFRSRQLSFNYPVHIEFAWDLIYLLGDSGLVNIRS
jgi:hypothetical protein